MQTILTTHWWSPLFYPTCFDAHRLAYKQATRPQRLEHLVDEYWADFLGCNVDLLLNGCSTHVTPGPNHFGFWAISRRDNWIVVLPPTAEKQVQEQVRTLFSPQTRPQLQEIQKLSSAFEDHTFFGPAAILLHKRPAWRFPHQPFVRSVTIQDQQAIAAFHAEAYAIPWTLESDLWVKIFGAFVDGQLVASCAIRVWGNLLAEIYVDTAPAHQRCGYGKAVTHAALNWIYEATPYYPEAVVDLANHASTHLMKKLGFEHYAYMVNSYT